MKNSSSAIQKEVWKEFWQTKIYDNLDIKEYHTDLKKIIEEIPNVHTTIEIGSGIGITSFLLSNEIECTLLDFDRGILEKAEQLFAKHGKKATFVERDMFDLAIDRHYDVVFNSGVIEHYNVKERTTLIKEYAKIMAKNGSLIIAVPNHFCIPYKLGYIVLRCLGKWKYPKEYAIKNLSKELKDAGMKLEKMIITSDTLIESGLKQRSLKAIYLFFKKLFKFQGYLRVFVIRKKL